MVLGRALTPTASHRPLAPTLPPPAKACMAPESAPVKLKGCPSLTAARASEAMLDLLEMVVRFEDPTPARAPRGSIGWQHRGSSPGLRSEWLICHLIAKRTQIHGASKSTVLAHDVSFHS